MFGLLSSRWLSIFSVVWHPELSKHHVLLYSANVMVRRGDLHRLYLQLLNHAQVNVVQWSQK
ncbi:hypothetical protein T01_9295 [Trichinella spiralis]|uniref:Uncharacterized protein n=1 Tax=Trichinella spiralis TaxID=6334 RepID=A0A0V0ZI40_TRISP|nr:hypothetical protein T01_9295 [Trichinella spiralis]